MHHFLSAEHYCFRFWNGFISIFLIILLYILSIRCYLLLFQGISYEIHKVVYAQLQGILSIHVQMLHMTVILRFKNMVFVVLNQSLPFAICKLPNRKFCYFLRSYKPPEFSDYPRFWYIHINQGLPEEVSHNVRIQ